MPTRGMYSLKLALIVRILVCRLPVSLMPLTFESISHLVLEGKWFFTHSRDGESRPALLHCVVDAYWKENLRLSVQADINSARMINRN